MTYGLLRLIAGLLYIVEQHTDITSSRTIRLKLPKIGGVILRNTCDIRFLFTIEANALKCRKYRTIRQVLTGITSEEQE